MIEGRFLITGGAGAIGSNIARELISRGHEVTVLDDLSSGYRDLVPEQARFIEGSITDDQALAGAFASSPRYVIHAAALFANQNSVEHPQDDLMINGLGLVKVLEGQTKRWEFEKAGAGDGGRAMAQYKVKFKRSIPSTLAPSPLSAILPVRDLIEIDRPFLGNNLFGSLGPNRAIV